MKLGKALPFTKLLEVEQKAINKLVEQEYLYRVKLKLSSLQQESLAIDKAI